MYWENPGGKTLGIYWKIWKERLEARLENKLGKYWDGTEEKLYRWGNTGQNYYYSRNCCKRTG